MPSLYLVTTPIGNINDFTLRAKTVLSEAEIIYCEDTRVFKDLCKRSEINYSDKKIFSFHDHSSQEELNKLILTAKEHKCAFVSDAGSPVISDPAYPIIKKCLEEGVDLKATGGISSLILALELSGLQPIPLHFHGFLPRDLGKLKLQIEDFKNHNGTHVFFEGKSRVLKTLELLGNIYPDLKMAICRELTKDYESVYRFQGKDAGKIKEEIDLRGEFVFLLENPERNTSLNTDQIKNLANEILQKGAKPKVLSKLIGEILNLSSKDVYKILSSTRQE